MVDGWLYGLDGLSTLLNFGDADKVFDIHWRFNFELIDKDYRFIISFNYLCIGALNILCLNLLILEYYHLLKEIMKSSP